MVRFYTWVLYLTFKFITMHSLEIIHALNSGKSQRTSKLGFKSTGKKYAGPVITNLDGSPYVTKW